MLQTPEKDTVKKDKPKRNLELLSDLIILESILSFSVWQWVSDWPRMQMLIRLEFLKWIDFSFFLSFFSFSFLSYP
jgi:hypothetical protein